MEAETLAILMSLHQDFPRWAVWAPLSPGERRVAVRMASARPPASDLPSVWAEAETSVELSERMARADASLEPGGWP